MRKPEFWQVLKNSCFSDLISYQKSNINNTWTAQQTGCKGSNQKNRLIEESQKNINVRTFTRYDNCQLPNKVLCYVNVGQTGKYRSTKKFKKQYCTSFNVT